MSCDLNGDGYEDLIVGQAGYNANQGRVYVFLGHDSWAAKVSSADVTLENPVPAQKNQFGRGSTCANVGGASVIDDLIVGAVDHDGPEVNEGAAFLYLGRLTWPATGVLPDTSFDNPLDEAGAAFGGASVGEDMDGDGLSDALIAAPASGKAFLFFGRTSWPASVTAADIELDNPDAQTGGFGAGLD